MAQTYSPSTVSKGPPPVPTKPRPRLREVRTDTSSSPLVTNPTSAYSHSMSLPRGTKKKPKPPPPLPRSQSQEHVRSHASAAVSATQSSDASGKQSGKKYTGSCEEVLSEGMSLQQLVTEYGDKVPIQIRILRGYCGSTSRTTFSQGDTYNVHFVKCTQVVTVRDASHDQFSIPINSAIKFGIIFNPENNQKKAIQGYTFDKVAKITALHHLPKVMSLMREVTSKGKESKEPVMEVLIVKGVHKGKGRGKKGLLVLSIETKTEKILPDSYCGSFSTQPSSIMLHLSDIIEHVVNPFPGEAIVAIDYTLACQNVGERGLANLPDSLFSKVIKICERSTEITLVSSMVGERDSTSSDAGVLIDIPVTEEELLDVEVAVVSVRNEHKIQCLNDSTRSMLETFDPMKVISCKDASSEVSYATQSLLYHAIRPGCEKLGVEILEPSSSIYDVPTAALKRIREQYAEQIGHQKRSSLQQIEGTNIQSRRSLQVTGRDRPRLPTPDESSDCYENETAVSSQNSPVVSAEAIHSQRNTTISPLPEADEPDSDYDTVINSLTYTYAVEETPRSGDSENTPFAASESEQIYDTPSHSYQPVTDNMTFSHVPSVIQDQICELQEATKQLKKDIVEISGHIRVMRDKLQAVDELVSGHQELASQMKALEVQKLAQPDQPQTTLELPTLKTEEANRKALCSMSAIEVQRLLEAMGLSQYRDTFASERLSGEILAELNEDILQHELKITNKIHRLRIMKVIQGQHYAQSLLAGLDPYVTFSSN